MVVFDKKELREPAGTKITSAACFEKVKQIMKEDPAVAELMKKLDYALGADQEGIVLDDDMYAVCYLDDGCEGCYANLMLIRKSEPPWRFGTLKTLNEGIEAWREMGTLAGEFAYLANNYIWQNT